MIEDKCKAKLLLDDWVRQERKRLYKGCGGFESFWGHQCKSTFINRSDEKVTVYCDTCQAELNFLKKLVREVKTE